MFGFPQSSSEESIQINRVYILIVGAVGAVSFIVGLSISLFFSRGSIDGISIVVNLPTEDSANVTKIELQRNTYSISELIDRVLRGTPPHRHQIIYRNLALNKNLIHTSFFRKIKDIANLDTNTKVVKGILKNEDFYYLRDSQELPSAIETLRFDEKVSENLRNVATKREGPWKMSPFRVLFTFPGVRSNIDDQSIAVCEDLNSNFIQKPGYFYLNTDQYDSYKNHPVQPNARIDDHVCRTISEDPLVYLEKSCDDSFNSESFQDFSHTRLIQMNDNLKRKIFGTSLASSTNCFLGYAAPELSDINNHTPAEMPDGTKQERVINNSTLPN